MHSKISKLEEISEKLSKSNYLVGIKETKRAVKNDLVAHVIIAKDVQEKVITPLIKICKEKGTDIIFVDSMVELGSAVHIDVKASAVAILKEEA